MENNHLPKHLQPVRIPRIILQKKKNHSAITRYTFFMLFAIGVSFIEKSRRKDDINIHGTGYGGS